tara:strand:+ start:252 stop:872 length:621 start_codon:yes stop_codon:yes gene_type:complete
MIKLNPKDIIKENKATKKEFVKEQNNEGLYSSERPEVCDAKVYKLKSAFVKNSVFITLSYVKDGNNIRPIEIFINSKDLTKTSEYVVLTRLISAIFRRGTNPMFILEELQGIFDPNGGSFKEGKYYHSFYSEIADVIERFFYDVKIIDQPIEHTMENSGAPDLPNDMSIVDMNAEFRMCPTCSSKSLKTENGCDTCVECGYSKCDK